ncbi:MAG: glycoside hydrolase family 3 N-terminal domain-containing protein [Bacteroidota bacterium]
MDQKQEKIQALISAMSVAEKAGQMTQLTFSVITPKVSMNADGSPGDEFGLDAEKAAHFIREYHIGSFLNGIAVPKEEWYTAIQRLQEINLSIDRHGIPILYGIDHVHGPNYLEDSTNFPHQMNLGATFDPQHAANAGAVTAFESAGLGHHLNFAPVFDLGRNPRYPRFYECYGEDPILCGQLGAAYVEALQSQKSNGPHRQVACAKHFIGYSDPKSGWDRSPSEISDQDLYEYFVPPFQAAIDAGVKTFMINGGEINGIPVHGSKRLLTDLLRHQMGFEGVVITDWEDVVRLHSVHRVADSPRAAVKLALEAGIDISMTPFTTDFVDHVVDLVSSGEVAEARLDESVRRILTLKMDLGLFETPYPALPETIALRTKENVAKSLQAARESLVLLRNEADCLPLANNTQVLLTGPYADHKGALSGGWTLRWIPKDESIYPSYQQTVKTALEHQLGKEQVQTLAPDQLSEADGDVVVYVAGELPYSEGSGNIYDYDLPQEQQAEIKLAQQSGKAVVLVVVAGRPRIIREVYDDCAAVIWAGLPGFEGGPAIAEVLCGLVNPSGRMPFSYPKYQGHFYPYFHKYMDRGHYQEFIEPAIWTAPFGHGLSYTRFEWSDLQISRDRLVQGETLTATCQVRNTGERDGIETALWFISDHYASITRPEKKLAHFARIPLAAGESKLIQFEIVPDLHLAFPDHTGAKRLESGAFSLMIGGMKLDFQLESIETLVGKES